MTGFAGFGGNTSFQIATNKTEIKVNIAKITAFKSIFKSDIAKSKMFIR